MGAIEKAIHWASKKLDVISGVALVAMMGLIVCNVVFRAVTTPILGTYEIISFLASINISFSLAYCAVNKGHIAMTLFVDRLGGRSRAFFDAVVAIISAAFFLVLTRETVRYAVHIRGVGEVGLTTEIPFYPFILGISFGFLALSLVLMLDLYHALKRLFKK